MTLVCNASCRSAADFKMTRRAPTLSVGAPCCHWSFFRRTSMKTFNILLLGGVALVGISFLVPEYETSPRIYYESIVESRLSASARELLLRTKEHDYEFLLPENHLNEVFLPPNIEIPPSWIRFKSPVDVTFEKMRADPDGAVATTFDVRFGGYKRKPSGLETVLSDRQRINLRESGFLPSNGTSVYDFKPPLYMVWNRELVGQQYPALTRNHYSGKVIHEECCIFGDRRIKISEDDPAKLARNRKINWVLTPLHAIKEGVCRLVTFPFVLLILLSGFRPGA